MFCTDEYLQTFKRQLILTTGEQYVAKRFFKLTAADSDLFESEVSVEANRVEVEGEITRLAIGTWFLNGFYRLCKSHGDVSVDTSELDSDPDHFRSNVC